jgi:effector-binding domain-containing protein
MVMFKIGEFARLNKVTIKALRHYASVGLLLPERIDASTGYRYYIASQMPRLNRIMAMKDIGFSLEEIYVFLHANMDSGNLRIFLEVKHSEILSRIRDEQERLVRIENYMKTNEEEHTMKYDCVVKKIEPVRVATIRDHIPTHSEQGHLWQALGEHIEKHGVKIVPPCMVIYHEGSSDTYVDAEVIEPIAGDLPETDRIKVKILGGVAEMACVVHKGPFQTLHNAYNSLLNWMEENRYEMAGPQRELYLAGEWSTADANEYITEIQCPVRKA